MIIYYSGNGSKAEPEITLGDRANIMLTYQHFVRDNKPNTRFAAIVKVREARRNSKKEKRNARQS